MTCRITCEAARTLFTRRLDDRLSSGEQSTLAEHLASCAACRAELARWKRAATALRASGPTPVPAGLAERAFRAALDAEPAPLAAWFVGAARRAALAGAVAAAAVWAVALATGSVPGAPARLTAEDPMELAVQLQLVTPETADAP
jgi:anti-sigma factor RsiW